VATIWNAISRGATRGHLMFQGRNPLTIRQQAPANSPSELANSATISFYLKNAPADPVQMEISSMDGARTVTLSVPATAGINRYFWTCDSPCPMPAVVARRTRRAAEDAAVVGAEGTRRPLGLQVAGGRRTARRWWPRGRCGRSPMRRNPRRRKAAAVVPSPGQEPIA
jgi:hypothetical protein